MDWRRWNSDLQAEPRVLGTMQDSKCPPRLYEDDSKTRHMKHWVEQGLSSHSTQFRSFRRRHFYRSDDPTNSVKALKKDKNKHKKHTQIQKTQNPLVYSNTMWWLEDSSHRGQDHQVWTVVGCHRGTPIWNKPSIFRQVCQSQPMYRLTEWHNSNAFYSLWYRNMHQYIIWYSDGLFTAIMYSKVIRQRRVVTQSY